ncbi:MAG TPA: tetratricopeptide repeat protein [Phycisphaerae bacterium]|nr:tetratricopeptide repeat protein [Phycisphaerae bacterium]
MAVKSQLFLVVLLAAGCAAVLSGSPWGCTSAENAGEQEDMDAEAQGKALQEKDEWHAAVECFTKAVALNPQFVEAYRHRGTLYLKMAQFDAAVSDYIEASKLETSPEESQRVRKFGAAAYYARAIAHRREGNYDKARADAEESQRLGGDDPGLSVLRQFPGP